MTVTRRTFLSRSSVGVAVAGSLATVPLLSTVLKMQSKPAALDWGTATTEPLVAHVRDVARGEISLMVGANKVVVRDADLASRLYAAAWRK